MNTRDERFSAPERQGQKVRLAHWSALLWVPPLAVIALWVAFFARLPLPGSAALAPVYLLIIAAGFVTPLIALVYALVRKTDPWAWAALAVNLVGLLFNGIGVLLGLAGAYT